MIPAWLFLPLLLAASWGLGLLCHVVTERRRILNFQANAIQAACTDPPAIRRHFIFALIGFIFLAVYGSWVPLKLSSLEIATAGLRLWAILQQPLNFDSRTDWITNVLLFVP